MPLYDVLGAKRKHDVMQDTWGHLYPEPGKKYPGKILIVEGIYGGTTILNYSFEDLNDSPQTALVIQTAMDIYDLDDGVYELECTLWFFKTCHDMYLEKPIGRIIKPKLKKLLDLSNWS
jgi:hypothetical protein